MSDDRQTIAIRSIIQLTPDVRRYTCDRPEGFSFEPGQATEVAIDREGWRDETRPFTFTSLPSDTDLEFTIKSYPDHDGVTEQLGMLTEGAKLTVGDAWGAITDKGPGTFIAGGAGVTPFIAILRQRQMRDDLEGCHLIVSDRTEADIILREELRSMSGLRTTFRVTDQPDSPLSGGRLDEQALKELVDDTEQPFYVCGPPEMVEDISAALKAIGADPDGITFEN